ncbi:hypothetical protein BDP55DRAFT_747525 [Colletotrichum godetiae]|uniref:Uncharacterized protein n=1 Tax=Colletotrichum godetiae TaxID=1209918 RepID=A0AAJ0AK07_9PEZI|nr:uncharacterized protein BDP55DRAFT_747525 [Colletotrichum godetiae]KAK1673828.1 hypothetical protein BDP55DRAFT_747525 [Colletotrichum godetiae]
MRTFAKRTQYDSRAYYEIYREDISRFSVGICERDATEVPDRGTFQVNFCYVDCKLTVQFWKLPGITTIDGTTAKKMTCELEVIPSEASMEFAVYIDGRNKVATMSGSGSSDNYPFHDGIPSA